MKQPTTSALRTALRIARVVGTPEAARDLKRISDRRTTWFGGTESTLRTEINQYLNLVRMGGEMQMRQIIARAKQYNEWRRGAEILPPSPTQVGADLDAVINGAERYEKLRGLNPTEFMSLYRRVMDGEKIDDMVDEL